MTFSPDLFLGTLDTGMGPKTPLSWLPCLLEGTEVHWHPGQRSCDSLLPSPEQRAIFEQQPPSGLLMSQIKQEGLAQYLPQPSKPCYFLGSLCSGCKESQRGGWDGEDRVSGLSLDGRREALGSRASCSGGWAACATYLGLGTVTGITVHGKGRCPWSAGDHDLGST